MRWHTLAARLAVGFASLALLGSCTTAATSSPSAAPTPPSTSAPPSTPPSTTPASTASTSPASSSDLFGLANATLDLPVRPAGMEGCAQGPGTKFVKGHSAETTQIATAIEADVDQDGAPEVVAGIDCHPPGWGESSPRQVVAFDRRADGTFATMGVLVQVGSADDENEIATVGGLEVTPRGNVRVGVGDGNTLHTSEFLQGLRQQRTYGWNGTAFVQTAGSTSFVVPPGAFDLSVDASPMTYAKPVNGMRAGTMAVTVRNDGATTVEDLSVQLAMEPPQAGCADPGVSPEPVCTVGSLAPGATRTVTFHHSVPACESGSDCPSGTDPHARVNRWADLQVRIGDQKYSETRGLPVAFK